MAVHYQASTNKQFCRSMVGLAETLTVGPVEALGNLHFFFIKKAILDFLTPLGRLSVVYIKGDPALFWGFFGFTSAFI